MSAEPEREVPVVSPSPDTPPNRLWGDRPAARRHPVGAPPRPKPRHPRTGKLVRMGTDESDDAGPLARVCARLDFEHSLVDEAHRLRSSACDVLREAAIALERLATTWDRCAEGRPDLAALRYQNHARKTREELTVATQRLARITALPIEEPRGPGPSPRRGPRPDHLRPGADLRALRAGPAPGVLPDAGGGTAHGKGPRRCSPESARTPLACG